MLARVLRHVPLASAARASLGARACKSTFFTKDHEYAKVAGATVTCGITDFAQAALGDVVFVSLPEVGTVVKKGCVCCMCAKGAGAWARCTHEGDERAGASALT